MPVSNVIGAYEDMRQLGDKALSAEKGVKVKMPSESACIHLRHRFYKFRSLERKRSRGIYAPGEPLYDSSPYDSLVATIQVDKDEKASPTDFWLIIKTQSLGDMIIEEIE